MDQAHADLNQTLGMLSFKSSVPYGCGDPTSDQAAAENKLPADGMARVTATKNLAQRQIDANATVVQGSLQFLRGYGAKLSQMAKDVADEQSSTDDIASGLKSMGAGIGTPGAILTGLGDVTELGKQLEAYVTNRQMQAFAQQSDPAVQEAIKNIEGHPQALLGGQFTSFHKWDACARESIYYLRDAPTWPVVEGQKLRFQPSSGAELFTIWQSYVSQRNAYVAKLVKPSKIKDDVDAIAKQQDALLKASAAGTVTAQSFKDAGDAISAGVKDVNGATQTLSPAAPATSTTKKSS